MLACLYDECPFCDDRGICTVCADYDECPMHDEEEIEED